MLTPRPRSLATILLAALGLLVSSPVSAARVLTIPFFEDTFTANGQTFTYRMVGTNPRRSRRTTRIGVVIVPLRFVFPDGATFDPGRTVSQLRTSPLFVRAPFASGVTQYGDAIQRAEFWTFTQGTRYHVFLRRPSVAPTGVVQVPPGQGITGASSRGGTVGLLRESFFAQQVVPAVINHLGLPPTKLTIFWSQNVDLQQRLGEVGAILGEHSLGTNQTRSRIWTWAWASWHTPDTAPPELEDVASLSHEIAEWYNDPFGSNAVPPWEMPPLYPCNNVLEVGDPLVGRAFVVNGYHLQDEAFLSWFARQTPSIGLGGAYSYLGILTAPPPLCGGP